MTIAALSRLDGWELVDKQQDIRGQKLHAADGRYLGTVDDMLVDTDRGYVTAIRLHDGSEYSVRDFEMRDGKAILLTGATGATGARRTGETARTGEAEVLRLREEELKVQKRAVQTGEVEIGKRVVSEKETMDVPVTREEVFVDRHPVERRPADRPIGEGADETIRVPVHEEQVSVEKRPVVTEEVSVGKRAVQETRQVSDTVRREEAVVDREGDIDRKDERRR